MVALIAAVAGTAIAAGTGAPPGTPESVTVTAICKKGTTSGTPPTITP
jgi:hypothetical protein